MNLNLLIVFLEGFLSFFAPCILPILPLYFGYLSTNAKEQKEDGTVTYCQRKIFSATFFFVLGICTSFLLLGLSFTALGGLIQTYQTEIALLSGFIIVIFGLFQLGILKIKALEREHKMKTRWNPNHLTGAGTFLLGFTFSFAWTPCVGPTLSSVLLLIASSSRMIGILSMVLYTLGFILPFLLIGIFTTPVLNFLKKNQASFRFFIKAAGFLIVCVGLSLVYQNGKVLFLRNQKALVTTSYLTEQYSNKVIVLTFLDRGCLGCKEEMPLINQLYQTYGANQQEVIFLGVMQADNKEEQEKNEAYLKAHDYTFPVIQEKGHLFHGYQVTSTPTTVILNQRGDLASKVIGVFEESYLTSLIESVVTDPCNTSVC